MDFSNLNDNKFVVRKIENKGKGMIATQNIKQGELIYAESPLMVINRKGPSLPQIETAFGNLNETEREMFLNLAYQSDGSKLDIFRTNSISHTLNNKSLSHLFPVICRVNHSCDANAHWKWNENTQIEQLIAAFDIKKGQEITANYLGMNTMLTFDVRQQLLFKNWGFKCQCNFCHQNQQQRTNLDLLIIKRSELMLECHKINEKSYEKLVELMEMVQTHFNNNPLQLFEHHLQALKCCVRSEKQDLREMIEYHKQEISNNYTKLMGKNTDLPCNVKSWMQ